MAERTERIGARPGQQGSAHGRFHASVRQAQGVGQPTYPASLRDVKFEPPAPAENATDAPVIRAGLMTLAEGGLVISLYQQTFNGSFSAVSKPVFAKKDAFSSIFQVLQDLHAFAPL